MEQNNNNNNNNDNNNDNGAIVPASHVMDTSPTDIRLIDSATGLNGPRWRWGTLQMAESVSLRKRLNSGLRVKYAMCVRVLYYHRCARDQAQNIYRAGNLALSASGFERMMFVSLFYF